MPNHSNHWPFMPNLLPTTSFIPNVPPGSCQSLFPLATCVPTQLHAHLQPWRQGIPCLALPEPQVATVLSYQRQVGLYRKAGGGGQSARMQGLKAMGALKQVYGNQRHNLPPTGSDVWGGQVCRAKPVHTFISKEQGMQPGMHQIATAHSEQHICVSSQIHAYCLFALGMAHKTFSVVLF